MRGYVQPQKPKPMVINALGEPNRIVHAIVDYYSKATGKGKIKTEDGKIYNFTSKREYLKRGVKVKCRLGQTRAYEICKIED